MLAELGLPPRRVPVAGRLGARIKARPVGRFGRGGVMMELLIQVENPREGRKLRAAWFLFQTWVPVSCSGCGKV